MTLRVGTNIIAGGGSSVKDNVTIVSNANDQIQTVGKINQNTQNVSAPVLYDWVGTLQQYQEQNVATEHPTWICFITDDEGDEAKSCFTILDFKWSDRNINDTKWLCADNFTWQSGNIYQVAYLHLFNDLYEDDVTLYAWASSTALNKVIYTKTETPAVDGWTYDDQGRQWKVISTVSGNEIDVLNAPAGEGGPYIRDVSGDMTITANLGVQHTETIAGTSITYYTAPDGHKICMPDQESAVQEIYNSTGVAWFYILDTTNTRFKLPRTKFGFTGLRNAPGDYVEPGLPNITGDWNDNLGHWVGHSASGAVQGTGVSDGAEASVSGTARPSGYTFDASRSSAIYGNGTTVQPPASEMYLYFYVGEFSQTAMANTAGITTEELNSKADVSMFQVVSALPANPDINTFYFVVE